MKLWITRDKDDGYGENRVCLWRTPNPPQKVKEDSTISFQDPEAILHEKLATLLVEEFVLLFDFKPKAGTCKRYEITKLKELNMKRKNATSKSDNKSKDSKELPTSK